MKYKKLAVELIIAVTFFVESFLDKLGIVWFVPYIMLSVTFLPAFRDYRGSEASRLAHEIIAISVMPYAVACVYTMFGAAAGISTFTFSIFRAVSNTFQMAYIILLASFMLSMFREDACDVLADSMILTYLFSMISAVRVMGLNGFLVYAVNPQRWHYAGLSYLELHDMGAAVGMLIIYDMFLSEKPAFRLQTWLLLAVMWLCNKRIELLAFIVALIAGMFIKNLRRMKNLAEDIIFMMVFACCFVYIFLIGSRMIYDIASRAGLSLAGRVELFAAVRQFYELSWTYMGCGFGFVGKFLKSIRNTHYAWALGNKWMAEMHNDILRVYIELGTWGCFAYYAYYLLYMPARLFKDFGTHAKYGYCLLIVYAYVSYTMDNTMTYFIFQYTFFVVLVCVCRKSSVHNKPAQKP